MKKEELPRLKAEALKLLPTTQANIWKTLKISAKDGSNLVILMMKHGLVKRTKVDGKFVIEKCDSTNIFANQDIINNTLHRTRKDSKIDEVTLKITSILPALQSDIWKKLNIKRRYCSKIIDILTKNNVIKRTKVKGGTYMVEIVSGYNVVPNAGQKSFSALLSDSGKFSPCTGCVIDCEPKTCRLITNWLLDIKPRIK